MASLKDLMLELSQRLGLEALQPDADGIYNLVYDNAVRLRVFEDTAAEELIFLSDVIDFPPGGLSATAMRALLLANFRWALSARGSFGVQPGTDLVEYALRESLPSMTAEKMEVLLKNVIACILTCRRDLSASSSAEAAAEAPLPINAELLKG